MPSSSRDRRYERNRDRRETQRQRSLMGETLAEFHARETAKPPTLAQIFAANHKNRERCTMTADLFSTPKPKRRAKR